MRPWSGKTQDPGDLIEGTNHILNLWCPSLRSLGSTVFWVSIFPCHPLVIKMENAYDISVNYAEELQRNGKKEF